MPIRLDSAFTNGKKIHFGTPSGKTKSDDEQDLELHNVFAPYANGRPSSP